MGIRPIFYFMSACFSLGHARIPTTEPYEHHATLRTGNVKLYWKFNDTHIIFEVHGETTGWIGLGFSPNGGMDGSDIFIGRVKNDEVKVTDRHGVGNAFPPLDPQQNIHVVAGAECDGWTMFKFSKQLAACESGFDREITQDTERVIWAWGDEDPVGDDIVATDYHGMQRGTESLYFLQSGPAPKGLPEGPIYKTFEIRANNFEIPAVNTYYNCRIFKLPEFGKKHHIVKYEPIITEGNEVHVHHMDIYRCGDVMEDPSELDKDVKCFTPNMQHFKTCTTMISAWAVGGEALYYPEDAGFSIGGEGDPVYIHIEMHYDNPGLKAGVLDSSGIRFTYTDSLRKHDVGIVQMGVAFNVAEHFVPPGAESFLSVGHCTSECWTDRMNASGINELNVFGVTLHSHLAGRSLKLRQIRNGVELPSPGYDAHYDFNYQETRYLRPHISLKPEDDLQMECVYSTTDRKKVTEGGLGTREEMCLAFVAYYPKINLGQCHSTVEKKEILKFFGIESKAVVMPDSDPILISSWKLSDLNDSKTLLDYFNEYAWTPENIKLLETYYNSAEHQQFCLPLDYKELIVHSFNVPEITQPYIESPRECAESAMPLEQEMKISACPGSSDTRSHMDLILLITSSLLQVLARWL